MKKMVRGAEGFLKKVNQRLLLGREDDIFHEVIPTGDLFGCLDAPPVNEINFSGTLSVGGWIFSKGLPIESLVLIRDNLPEETIIYRLARPDVAKVFTDVPDAGLSGFRGNIVLGQKFSGRVDLKIWAILENGERICCFARRVQVQNVVPLPPKRFNFTLFLYGAAVKAFKAIQHKRLSLSPIVWVRQLRRYYWQIQSDRNIATEVLNPLHPWQTQDPYQRWIETNRLTPKLLARLEKDAEKLKTTGAKISLVVPVYNTPSEWLQETIASVTAQIYPNWELCLADDASPEPHVKEILEQATAKDVRIKVIFRPQNGHIVEATNSALDLATGEYVALLDHDDLLPPDALLHVAEYISKHPDVDWIYTDEDKIDQSGRRYDPQMKGAWSPEMAIAHNYTHHLTVIRQTLIEKVGRLRTGFEGAQDLDLFLRVSEHTTPDKIGHIPRVCYHWRSHSQSTASHGTQKRYVFDSAKRAISEAIQRRGLKAELFLPAISEKHGLCLYQLKWNSSLLAQNPVTIVIPTRDRVDLLEKCVASLEKTVDSRFVKLIIIDDGSQEPKTHQYLKKLEQEKVFQCRIIPSGRTHEPFNYARLMNLGAAHVDTPYMLHLNNDIEATAPGWLEDMVGWMSIAGVGVVGAKLLYPDQTIQHAGVVIGPHHGLADHQFDRLPKDEVGYICLPHTARNVSAVTGACLLTSTALYHQLGGFDPANFAVQYNDVDYCLKVVQAHKRVVYTPQATLIHRASSSRGKNYDYTEHLNFIRKYQNFQDPFFNENLNIDLMWMAINPQHFCYSDRISSLKVLFITHNLNLEGAPLMAYNFARYFVTAGKYEISVLSTQDGLLQSEYEKINIPIKIVRENLPLPEETLKQYRNRLKELGDRIEIASFDLVIANTLTSFWGVELAKLFGLPSIWHIHESSTIEASINNFFGMANKDLMRNLLPECFSNASRSIFVAEATRRIFHGLDKKGYLKTISGGVPIEQIDQFRRSHTKSELRAKHGIPENDIVITIVGTICERKGQHVFIEAIKELETELSGKNFSLSYVLVGGKVISYFNMVQSQIEKFNLKNIHFYDKTKEIYDFFAMSDLFVCSSFEESFPQVLLEAMAFELKIVSTNVFGIPEMIGDRHEGFLVEPGNSKALAEAIQECLEKPEESDRLAKNAYIRACRMYDNKKLLHQHLLLTKEVALVSL